jgi:predicted tellurium resistance membrane protein TerC
MIIKDKSVVFISFIIAIFTWAMGAFYLIDYLDILNKDIGIEGIYACLVIVVAVLMFLEKGSEKW